VSTHELPASDAPRRRYAELDRLLREAVLRERAELSGDVPTADGTMVRARRTNSPEAPYAGYLSWSQLGNLVAQTLRHLGSELGWDGEAVVAALKSETALPHDLRERQILLEALQREFNRCFDYSTRVLHRVHVNRQENYEKYLGDEPVLRTFHEFDFDPATIGFFPISEWTEHRQLERHNVGEARIRSHRPRQKWITDTTEFAKLAAAERRKDPGSPCPTLVDYIVDSRESQGDKLILTVAHSDYSQHVAISTYLDTHPELYDQLRRRIQGTEPGDGLAAVIQNAPPSNIVINVTVLSRTGSLLLLQRAEKARVWPSRFQVGPHETMNWTSAGEAPENCFDLAERALREEVGLDNPDLYYDKIVFSWFGYYMPNASAYFFAHVRTSLTKDEILERIDSCEGRWEVKDARWMNLHRDDVLDREAILDILSTWRQGSHKSGLDSQQRAWLPHAVMSLSQLSRVIRQKML